MTTKNTLLVSSHGTHVLAGGPAEKQVYRHGVINRVIFTTLVAESTPIVKAYHIGEYMLTIAEGFQQI